MTCEHEVSLEVLCVRCDIDNKQWKLDEALACARNEGYEAAREQAALIVLCFRDSAYDRIRAMQPEEK